jgi:hypothetical protein
LNVAPGAAITLTAEAASGASFAGWSGCASVDGALCSAAAGSKIGAEFEPQPPAPQLCIDLSPAAQPTSGTSFVAKLRDPGDDSCEPATSDGSGTVLVHYNHDTFPGESHLWFVSPDGASAAAESRDAFQRDLVGQEEGFEGGSWFGNNLANVELQDDTGTIVSSAQAPIPSNSLGVSPRPVADPSGGIVVANRPSENVAPFSIQAYAADGSLRWTVQLAPGTAINALGVDVTGQTLVLTQLESTVGAGPIEGTWIDGLGDVTPSFVFETSQDGFGLSPRVGGGFFVHRFTVDLPSENTIASWAGQIEPRAMSMSAPPAWLAARPNDDVVLIHGGAGYALTPIFNRNLDRCVQRIDVVTAAGELCGTFPFPVATSACVLAPPTIGVDGTVMQQFPAALEQLDTAGRSATCSWRWWSGFFK